MERRQFLELSIGAVGGLCLGGCNGTTEEAEDQGKELIVQGATSFKISLAQWSLHKRLFGRAEPKMDNLDFAKQASDLGIKGIEYVNQFFKDKARDEEYLGQMKKRAQDAGVQSLLIMCDGEGHLGDPDTAKRAKAVSNHHQWVEAAKFLGCHSIRVNAHSEGSFEEQQKLAADGLRKLSEFAASFKINVIVENHGGLSSDPTWLVGVMNAVNLPNCGTLPDFGNFPDSIDRYEAVKALMPFAKAVSAKSYDFNNAGSETKIDYFKMMDIVLAAGYGGFVGIEYEGSRLKERDGIVATKILLEKIQRHYAKA